MLKDNINDNGSIVIMSSNDAYPGAFGSMSYSISKSALISLMKCLCVNFGDKRVRVNSVAPGAINTDMNTPEQEFEAPLYTPIERIGQPAEVAEVVYFLVSDSASFINGENITIDGGYNIVSILLKNEAKRVREE
jgi:3-oxoacyl-[acyl-carrier protein] reductase